MDVMRRAVVVVAVIDALAIVGLVVGHPGFWLQPSALFYVVPALVMLGVYAVGGLSLIVWPTMVPPTALRGGAVVGLALGIVEIINITVETFGGLNGTTNIAVTAPLILGPFLVWGWVGAHWARRAATTAAGLTATYAAAAVTMLSGVTFGLLLVALAPDRIANGLLGDPDFARSGWDDVHLFALANTFENAFTHLLGALVVATFAGIIGTVLGLLRARRHDAPIRPRDTSG